MAGNDYHFITHWRVQSTVEEVYDILSNPTELPRWWQDVYLNVKEMTPGNANGVGKQVRLLTKGYLPYRLKWEFRVTETRKPYGLSIKAWGDFDGVGVWNFQQENDWVSITYNWKIRADKPLLRRLSFLLKPAFSVNHRWAMAKGEKSLRQEIARRKALTA